VFTQGGVLTRGSESLLLLPPPLPVKSSSAASVAASSGTGSGATPPAEGCARDVAELMCRRWDGPAARTSVNERLSTLLRGRCCSRCWPAACALPLMLRRYQGCCCLSRTPAAAEAADGSPLKIGCADTLRRSDCRVMPRSTTAASERRNASPPATAAAPVLSSSQPVTGKLSSAVRDAGAVAALHTAGAARDLLETTTATAASAALSMLEGRDEPVEIGHARGRMPRPKETLVKLCSRGGSRTASGLTDAGGRCCGESAADL